jgi:hypothetical protein
MRHCRRQRLADFGEGLPLCGFIYLKFLSIWAKDLLKAVGTVLA